MSGGKAPVYFDASVFIAWLVNEARKWGSEAITAIGRMLKTSENGDLVVVTSIITRIEVLDYFLDEEGRQSFKDLYVKQNLQFWDVDLRIAEKAHEIRTYTKEKTGTAMHTPDAIHLATALHTDCNQLYTFDIIRTHPELAQAIAEKYGIPLLEPKLADEDRTLFPRD